MISLVPSFALGAESSPTATSSPTTLPLPTVQKLTTKVMSRWEVLVVGVITGFGLAAGGLLFNKLAKRARWA
jgi:hypothetical protein